ncbi:sugar transferase [Brevundimonas sp.]|uniref:sugar transferase n=1 Tax=Brevundimonas sp. TaxID=1871086 RepID=UPI0028B0AA47|nr:sugar transferase [Brevundimonas sp.]
MDLGLSASQGVSVRPLGRIPPLRAPSISDGQWVRLLDIMVATAALVLLAPLLLVVAAVIYLSDGGAPIFRHARVGKDGQIFGCLKFRSMICNADAVLTDLLKTNPNARESWERDHKLHRDPRVTRLGKFLRKSSLDELPQLLNVLQGDMSIVGPRPIVVGEIERYGGYFQYYCAVRPGITGLWQVSGRNDMTYRRRVACDVLYARNKSLRTDLKIIVATLPAVTSGRGSY